MFSSRSSIVFLFSFAFPILVSSIVSESKSSDECQFGECAAWHILLVPLLTDRFTQVPLLKAIIRSMLSGCRWYFPDQIQLEMFTKNASFVPIRDPILLPELDIMLSEFKFSTEDRAIRLGQWHNSVQMAVDKMNGTDENVRTEHSSSSEENKSSSEEEKAQRSRGRFIFVITDFEQSQSGHGSEFLGELDRQLAQSGIFFRNVRLQFDGHKQTQIIPGGHPSFREDINNISQNIVRVAIVEPALGVDAFQAIRPCPQLSDAEKIREYSYVQHFYYENWFQRNPRGALIGFGLFLCAMICAVLSYLFHLWELTRTRRKAARQQQQGNNPQIGSQGE